MPKAAAPKRYAVTLDPNDAGKGMKLVSLVKTPAIGAGWVALAAVAAPAAKRVHLSEATEGPAKQVLTGPLLIPGLDILRLDEKNEPFYINFSAEQIEAIAHRFMQQGTGLTQSNADHAETLDGNTIRELWLTADAKIDKAAHYGIDVPAGTLMASMHVADADFWENEVKTGNKTGFSIEGLFDFSELHLSAAGAAPKKPMSFLSKLRAAVALAFADTVALAAVELKDGTALEVDEASGEVFQLNADGTRGTAQPDGTYELSDGTEFIVTDGKHVGHTDNSSDTDKAALATPPAAPAAKPTAAPATPPAAKPAAPAAKTPDSEPATEARLVALETAVAALQAAMKKDDASDATGDAAKMGAVQLESVEMLDGSTLSYNPITRSLMNAAGQLVTTGYYACADGNFFKVNTDQYTYQIDADTYAKATTQLSAVTEQLTKLSATAPAGKRVTLGADAATGKVDLEALSPGARRLALAKQRAASAQ